MYNSPQAFYDRFIGKSVDVDNYPPGQPDQCWDLKAKFVIDEGLKVNTYCNLTGYAGDLYKLRYEKGYDKYFEFFYPKHAQKGDWIYWDRHVAMVWDVDLANDRVLCLGQNQSGHPYVDLKWYKLSTALGCMRYKKWMKTMNGWVSSNGKWYFYRDGDKLTGWHKLTWSQGENWFFFDSDGVMVTGWRKITYKGTKQWFYFDSSGAMVTGFTEIDGKWYFLNDDGTLFSGEKVLTLSFDASGAMEGEA